MKVVGLIPARGGSKGVPRKNVRLLLGRPLLAYTADAARSAGSLARVVLTTDDAEIAELGRSLGLDVPFVRPPELARDETAMLPVVQHAIEQLAAGGEEFDAVCLLQPTCPLRTADDIDRCIALMKSVPTDSVVSVLRTPAKHNPHWVYFAREDGSLVLSTGEVEPIARRQALPPAFHRDGSIYLTRTEVVRAGSLFGARTLGYEMDPERSVNIDEPADWDAAERSLRARQTA